MEYVSKKSLDVRNGVNGNLSAMCYVQGRMACQQGKSIFDCPFETGTDKYELWIDGFMHENQKTFAV